MNKTRRSFLRTIACLLPVGLIAGCFNEQLNIPPIPEADIIEPVIKETIKYETIEPGEVEVLPDGYRMNTSEGLVYQFTYNGARWIKLS